MNIASIERNIISSSDGGRFDRDHAEATFCNEKKIVVNHILLGIDTYPDDAGEDIDVAFLCLNQVNERIRLLRTIGRSCGGWRRRTETSEGHG